MLHDVFICHASEDKRDFVRPLAEALRAHHVEVWYDEFTLRVGDSLREAIDRGLSSSRFGIVVLSPSFFQKRWPNRELNGLVARETDEDRQLILPVWHKVERADVLEFSPSLADLVAISSASGMDQVVGRLLRKLRPEESPLIVARDFLIEKGVPPLVITDEWWLDIIEIKEAEFRYPDLNHDWRWIFPLPFPHGDRGKERGLNIAWTALQLDWVEDARKRKICQLTHPETVHAFLQEWPGLQECARNNPATLALYAPQLTIPGFDSGFADVFDQLMAPDKTSLCDASRYGTPDTEDGKDPLCGDFIAWRHPSYGNFTASELSYEFVNAHNTLYSRKVFNGFECLVWLLTHHANWMPDKLQATLRQGFRSRVHWWMADLWKGDDSDVIADALLRRPRSRFAYTKTLKAVLLNQVARALHELELNDNPDRIAMRFLENGFLEGYYEEQERFRREPEGKVALVSSRGLTPIIVHGCIPFRRSFAMPSQSLTIDGWMIGWNPDEPTAVEVGAWPDRRGWSDRYEFTTGCCELDRHNLTNVQKVARMFIDFHSLVVGDGMDPQAVHREFLKIDEYRRCISPDIAGAEHVDADEYA